MPLANLVGGEPSRNGDVPSVPRELITARAAFDDLLRLELAEAPERSLIVPVETRIEALEHFGRLNVPRPGRDWKHDYTKFADQMPRYGETRSSASHPHLLLAPESIAASVAIADPLLHTSAFAPGAAGFSIRDLRTLSDEEQALLDASFGRAVRWREDKFASLAVAFLHVGVLIHVAAGARVERPILINHDVGGTFRRSFPYVLVVLEDGAQATIVEDSFGPEGFACGIVEAVVGERAQLDYVAVQRADGDGRILMNRAAVCGAGATCRWFLAETGGALSRSAVTTRLAGRGASSEIAGFFFNSGDQHVDLASVVEHASGDTTSRTTIKSAATGNGQGRYLGNIQIAAHANGSDATLRDDALLLSKHAHIDSVPALEIASNDVKAFHGATVGSIDEDELFYAQSRGIPRSEAERMIALGFFEPVVATFPFERIREFLRTALADKVGAVGQVVEAS
jgi:Fe-S cluster assembly protein SufD